MVALEGLLPLLQIFVQLLLFGKSHGVDTLKHLAVAVAAPIGAAALGQLDGITLDAAGGVQVGACAQVYELALLIKRDVCVGGQIVNKLHLVGLVLLLHEGNGLGPGQLKALQLQLFLADLAHLRLQGVQMLLGKVEGGVEVVVKAALDAGTNGQLHLRIQALNGLGQHMGAGVPIGFAILRVFKGIDVFFAHGSYSPFLG